MADSLSDRLRAARVYDLEQPRFFGMPIYPGHRPGYFYALRLHGGTPSDSVETPAGFPRLGVETVPPLLRRGVLLDVAGRHGPGPLPPHSAVSAEDLRGCAADQGSEVRPG